MKKVTKEKKIVRCGFYVDVTATRRISSIMEAMIKIMISKIT